MKKLLYCGLASLSLGLYCIKSTLKEHPDGVEVFAKENIESSFACNDLITEVRSNISDVNVFYFKNKSKGLRSRGFFTNPPFFVDDKNPRIYLSLDHFDTMQSTCFHESFHAYLSLSETNLEETTGIVDLKDFVFQNSDLIPNLFSEFDFDNEFKNPIVKDLLLKLLEVYPLLSSKEFLDKFQEIANLLAEKFSDSDVLNDQLIVKRIKFALFKLKYLLSDDELIARLFTSYFYDSPDSYYGLLSSDLSENSVFISYLTQNFPELVSDFFK